MNIDKTKLKTLWYEDENGKEIDADVRCEIPPTAAKYQVSRFPLEVRTTFLRFVSQEEVSKCKHKHKYIKRTFGWQDGMKGRECQNCNGTQVRKWWQPWGRKWDAHGSRPAFTGTTTIGDGRILLAMANSGDYTLEEAMIAYSEACEKCANVLWHKYTNGQEGYPEGSEEWNKCGTSCKWCQLDTSEVREEVFDEE